MVADPNGKASQQKRSEREGRRKESALSRATVDLQAGGGLVRLRIDGLGRVRQLEIAPEAFEGRDPDLLADLIMSAFAEGQRRADDLVDRYEMDDLGLDR